MQLDIIVSWPSHLDYPLWRRFIHKNRYKFNKVIIIFTNMNAGTGDYRQFIHEAMAKDNVIIVDNDPVSADQDWRNVAVNKALQYSDAEWIWFTEQDFLPLLGFWGMVSSLAKREGIGVFGYFQDSRLHPCCIFIKKALLDKTSKNFGVVTDRLDHFGLLQEELEARGELILSIPSHAGKHMNGLSQNMFMLQKGEDPNYDPQEFKKYCLECLESGINLHPDFEELFHWELEK